MPTKLNEVWSAADSEGLQRLRLAAGWDTTTLARRSSLSVAQVVQLEEGGDSHFYTPAIKHLAGRQAIKALRTWAASQTASTPSLTRLAEPGDSPAVTPNARGTAR
jgi:transcriptional regulator with XRE-family HTH domain